MRVTDIQFYRLDFAVTKEIQVKLNHFIDQDTVNVWLVQETSRCLKHLRRWHVLSLSADGI